MRNVRKTRARRATKGRKPRARIVKPRRSMRRSTLNWKLLPVGFTKTKLVKMRYVDTISLDTGSGVVASYAYRANDLYDPDYTGSGHQPYTFDQWSVLYELCHVIGAKCTVRYTPTAATSSSIAAMLGVTCDTNRRTSTTYPSYSAFLEKAPGSKIMVGQHYTNGSFLDRKQSVSCSFTPRKVFNVDKKTYIGDPDYACTASTSTLDANTCYFNINLVDVAGGNPDAMTFTVIIDYIVHLSQRLTTATS